MEADQADIVLDPICIGKRTDFVQQVLEKFIRSLPAALPDAVRVLHFGSYTTAVEPTGSTLLAPPPPKLDICAWMRAC